MKILIVSTYDRGGAANSSLRLLDGLLRENIDVKVLVKDKVKSLPNTFKFHKTSTPKSKVQVIKQKMELFLQVLGILKMKKHSFEKKFIKQRSAELELFSFPNSNFDITTSPLYQEADIINLHWVGYFLDYESFFRKNTKPVVWTLHDMNPFTGGEHYLETFLGMDASGRPLTRVLSKEEQLVARKNLELKQKIMLNTSQISIIAPSKWLYREARQSQVFNTKDVYCIPYGVDSELYQPRDREYSRNVFNIPKDKIVLLFVAESISNHRKGYAYLKKALDLLQRDDIVLCAIGGKEGNFNSDDNLLELGIIADERLMSIAYSAADVFVIPSLMDNLPNTVLESLMCGTPVIGFPVGGIPDMIEHGQNGLLADEINSHSLFMAIEQFLNTQNSFDRNHIREQAVSKYTLSIQANAYINLFKDIFNVKVG